MSNRTRLGYLAAVLSILFGLAALLLPYWMILLIGFDFSEARPWGVSEMRATYGALFVAMGGVMLWALPIRPRGAPYLRFAGILWLAAAVGRVFSLVIDGALTPLNFALLGLELLVGVPTILASFETPRRNRAEIAVPEQPPYP